MLIINSQGTPSSGEFPQLWGNPKFLIWGISPELGKWHILSSLFDMVNLDLHCYNYSGISINMSTFKNINVERIKWSEILNLPKKHKFWA